MKNYFLMVPMTLLFSNTFLYSMDHELVISAVTRGDIHELESLKARGVNIAAAASLARGDTALIHAIDAKKFETAKWLVRQAGVPVNKTNIYGVTPLIFACQYEENQEIIKFLLEQSGIDVDAISNTGETALSAARRHLEYREVLGEHREKIILRQVSQEKPLRDRFCKYSS